MCLIPINVGKCILLFSFYLFHVNTFHIYYKIQKENILFAFFIHFFNHLQCLNSFVLTFDFNTFIVLLLYIKNCPLYI